MAKYEPPGNIQDTRKNNVSFDADTSSKQKDFIKSPYVKQTLEFVRGKSK